jgi:hypothetical protein
VLAEEAHIEVLMDSCLQESMVAGDYHGAICICFEAMNFQKLTEQNPHHSGKRNRGFYFPFKIYSKQELYD